MVVDKKALPLFIAQHLNFCFVTHDVQVQWTILMHLLRDLGEFWICIVKNNDPFR